MKQFLGPLLAASALFATAAPTYAVSLTTTFAGGNGNAGIFFDVVTLGGALSVSSLDISFGSLTTATVDLYTRTGTWVGNNSSPVGWNLVGSAILTPTGIRTATPLNLPFALPGSSTTGIYIFTSTTLSYTNGTAIGNVAAANSDLQILEGAGSGVLFSSFFNANRIFNGTFNYSVAGAPEVDSRYWGTTGAFVTAMLLLYGSRRRHLNPA